MTLSSTTSRASYTANGAQTVFAYPFRIDDQTHLQVYVDDVLQNAGFAVSGVGNDGGGNVTFVAAPASAANVTLIRAVPLTQPTDLPTQGALDTAAIEKRFDQVVMQIQGLRELIDRSIVLPPSAGSLALQLPALEASRFLAANADADELEWALPVDSTIVSAPMIPVVGAASLAAGRTNLGLANLEAALPLAAADAHKVPVVGATGALVFAHPRQHEQNVIINPTMTHWQAWPGTAMTSILSAGPFTPIDMFVVAPKAGGGTTAADGSVSQGSNLPAIADFGAYLPTPLRFEVTTADASASASDSVILRHRVEGTNYRRFAQQQFTVGLILRTNVTGIYYFYVTSAGGDRSFFHALHLTGDGAWRRHEVTVPASPSSGTWAYDTASGVELGICLQAGGNWVEASPGTWVSNAHIAQADQVNMLATIGNYIEMAAMWLRPGSHAGPVPSVDAQAELARCQRYLLQVGNPAPSGSSLGYAFGNTSTDARMVIRHPVEMRVAPAAFTPSGSTHVLLADSSANYTSTAFALNSTFTNKWETHVNVTVASGLTADRIYVARTNGSNKPMIINASM